MVTPEHTAHDWRNHLLNTLSQRGTADAVLGICRIAESYPDDLGIRAALVTARRQSQAEAAVLLTPRDIIDLFRDPHRRIIGTALQLGELLIDTINDIARDLDSHANVLWDCERAPRPTESASGTERPGPDVWRPKPEGTLAAYLAHELSLRLDGHRVVVNREVVVKPTDAGDSGKRPDIVVDAITSMPNALAPKKLCVPVEIKGSWHHDVLTAQEEQLAGQYMPDMHTRVGVYLVGVFHIELWDAEDGNRKARARKAGSADKLLRDLSAQAKDIHLSTGLRTLPCVISVVRATPHSVV